MISLNTKSTDGRRLTRQGRMMVRCICALLFILSFFISSCNRTSGVDESLRQAEMAIAEGDMTVAKSVAEKLGDDKSMTEMSAGQLARLSMVYMQLADGDENHDLAANAADCYRRAYQADKDSADAYYNSLTADHAETAGMLKHLVSAADATYSFDDSVPDQTDELYYPDENR